MCSSLSCDGGWDVNKQDSFHPFLDMGKEISHNRTSGLPTARPVRLMIGLPLHVCISASKETHKVFPIWFEACEKVTSVIELLHHHFQLAGSDFLSKWQ